MTASDLILTGLLALMALLYASVGHAGSSGYQAAMGIMGVSAAMMKPTALCLNVIVSLIATWQFARQGCVDVRRWAWLAVASVPAAVLGGFWELPTGWYHLLVAVVLWAAAVRLWMVGRQKGKTARWEGEAPAEPQTSRELEANSKIAGYVSGDVASSSRDPRLGGSLALPPCCLALPASLFRPLSPYLLLLIGGVLGFLSGLTGTGGGIFLTPLLVLGGWATPRQAAGLSAAFILANSPAGLLGWWWKQTNGIHLPELLPLWMILVAAFGWLGAWYGSKYGSPVILRRLLAVVLVIAGVKMALAVLR